MTTQALRTTLLVFLSVYLLSTLFYLVVSFSLEQFGYRLSGLDIFDMAYLALMLAQWAVVVTGIIGIVRAIKQGSAPLPNILHFPLIWYFTNGLFSLGFQLLQRPDPMQDELPLQGLRWVYHLLFLCYTMTCIMYFAREKTPTVPEGLHWVSPWSRLFAYLLDILLVMTIFMNSLRALAFGNSVLDDYPFLNDGPYPLISIALFIYFFASETVFARTLGKAVNGSFVVFERGRVLSVLWRTLSRYIPLEAFSYISRSEGWHDTLSRTTVRQARTAELSVPDPIPRADELA